MLYRLCAIIIDLYIFFFEVYIPASRWGSNVLGGMLWYSSKGRLILGTFVDSDVSCPGSTRLWGEVLVDMWPCVLHAWARDWTCPSQSFWWSDIVAHSYDESPAIPLDLAIFQQMIRSRVNCLSLRSRNRFPNSLATKCGLFPVNRMDGISYVVI